MTRLADLCGSWRGWLAHKRIGEKPCVLCREIASARRRSYRRQRTLNQGGELMARRPDLADIPTLTTRLIAAHVENA